MIYFYTWFNKDYPIVIEQIAETALSFGQGCVYVDGIDRKKNVGTGLYPADDIPEFKNIIRLDEDGLPLCKLNLNHDHDVLVVIGHDQDGIQGFDSALSYRIDTPTDHHLWSSVAAALFLSSKVGRLL